MMEAIISLQGTGSYREIIFKLLGRGEEQAVFTGSEHSARQRRELIGSAR
jgi:hypothetical protein